MSNKTWFGLAPLKREGGIFFYDLPQIELTAKQQAKFEAMLPPGRKLTDRRTKAYREMMKWAGAHK